AGLAVPFTGAHPPGQGERHDVVDLHGPRVVRGELDGLPGVRVVQRTGEDFAAVGGELHIVEVAGKDVVARGTPVAVGVDPAVAELFPPVVAARSRFRELQCLELLPGRGRIRVFALRGIGLTWRRCGEPVFQFGEYVVEELAAG